MPAVLIAVRFHDGRYHGRAQGGADWPPSPWRLFQALVAGAARGASLSSEDCDTLAWLEQRDAPAIAAPPARLGQGFTNFVPNNDLDAVGGDPRRIGGIRAGKSIRPLLFDAETPLLYVWRFKQGDEAPAQRLCMIAEHLYQLGRGVDMAWARGEALDDGDADAMLVDHRGAIHRPSEHGSGRALDAPTPGSLKSLTDRHDAGRKKFTNASTKHTVFTQPPKPRFRQIVYDSPPVHLLFDLVGARAPWRFESTAQIAELVRDAAAKRLKAIAPDQLAPIDSVMIGSRESGDADKPQRVRIVPLPSIGHAHVHRSIKRILVAIPPNCPLRATHIERAFSGLEVIEAAIDSSTGEVSDQLTLIAASDRGMLRHYGVEDSHAARVWRTVTPAALAISRRRIDPQALRRERDLVRRGDRAEPTEEKRVAKGGKERAKEEANAAAAVWQALRHSGIAARSVAVRVQREPFEAKGARAELFAPGTRFAKERLWHVEVQFTSPQPGPLVIGDGRYLGLGILAPSPRVDGVMAFAIDSGIAKGADAHGVARALRRAVLARVQAGLGEGKALPLYFTGHAGNGAKAQSGAHEHLAFAYDERGRRVLLIAPHVLGHRAPIGNERLNWRRLEEAMADFRELRAGASGKLRLARAIVDAASDPLLAPAREWESAAPYHVARHRKLADAGSALAADISDECRRLGFPPSKIETSQLRGIRGAGLVGRARLRFGQAVPGPIMIGRNRHFGGGLFVGSKCG